MTFYRERLWPTPWMFIILGLVIPASLLVFLPINQTVGVITAIVLYLGIAGILATTAPVIAVTDSGVTAGRATLPLVFVGDISSYQGTEATQMRGPKLDARAWLLIRGWVDPVVKIAVDDSADPTPYWIVSTRKPDELIAAVAEARQKA